MGTSVLQKGKHCIEAAREAYYLMTEQGADEATASGVTTHLEALIEDGKYLQRSAKQFLNLLESEEDGLDKKMQQLQTDKGKFEMEIEASEKEKSSIEGKLSAKKSVLKDNESIRQRAQKELQDAENELQRAKKKLKKKKKGFFGKVKSAFKKLAGIRDSAEKKVKSAKKNLERRVAELTSAQNAASKTQQELTAIQTKIEQLQSKIQGTQQQVNKKHADIGLIKSSIALLRKSVHFWELFVTAAQNAEERVAALKSIVDQASETKDYELLKEDGTITRAKSFIEAWEIIATDPRIQ